MKDPPNPWHQLQNARAERPRLREENERLKSQLRHWVPKPTDSSAGERSSQTATAPALVTNISPPDAKIALFRSLFRGRDDVYALRWDGRNGNSGYSPAGPREWDHTTSARSKRRPGKVNNPTFFPVTDVVIRDHLVGRHTVGIYPLLPDETCYFLAADFDKKSWQEDAKAFLATCRELGVPAALERSRSGNGGHIWIFFSRAIPAVLARKLGCLLLTRTMERRHQLGLESYDRFFPNQDTMPKGGFGNLIALPLQRQARNAGNSVFLNDDRQPHQDQWLFLSTIEKMLAETVELRVQEALRHGDPVDVKTVPTDEGSEEAPWKLPPSGRQADRPLPGPLPDKISIVRGNLLYIEKKGLPPPLFNRLMRLAAFENPEFYKAEALRLSTFGKPRVIGCAKDFPNHLGLPRGCLDDVLGLLDRHHIRTELVDERFTGIPITVRFLGELRPDQRNAAEALLNHDDGILSAPTAFGKTVVAAWLIAARKVNTLVLVHRRHLMDQWRERLALFLELPEGGIGELGGGRNARTGQVDVAIIQSLNTKGEVKDLVAEYGHVIVDECHHIPAFTFEQVLSQSKAKYVLGLTATPLRKDGHHPIIAMQCGPLRLNLSSEKLAFTSTLQHTVIPRYSNFQMPTHVTDPGIQDIYAALAEDQQRNETIVSDVVRALRMGRSPLLLTERKEHLERLATNLGKVVQNLFVLKGGMGKKERAALSQKLRVLSDTEPRVILATGRYIGEGFDDARLDTLFLAAPISWRGTLQQYVGRLHRFHDNKRVVQVFDYVDIHVPMLRRMYEKRSKGYRAMGYRIAGQDEWTHPERSVSPANLNLPFR